FVFIYGLKNYRNSTKDLLKFWSFPFLFLIIQLGINYYYFGNPLTFNLKFWDPDFAETYQAVDTVVSSNPALKWSFLNFTKLWELQWDWSGMTMLKWMFWFYPALLYYGFQDSRIKLEYILGVVFFHIYL